MSNIYALDETCGPAERILRHERELGNLTTITDQLKEQNASIAESLENLNSAVSDIRSIKENIKEVTGIRDKLVEFNTVVSDLNSNVKDLKNDLQAKEIRLLNVEGGISHLGWLNLGIKKLIDNLGFVFIACFILLIMNHLGLLTEAWKLIGG